MNKTKDTIHAKKGHKTNKIADKAIYTETCDMYSDIQR